MTKVFGGILMAVGGLIAGTAGLCTLAVFFNGLGSNVGDFDAMLSGLSILLIFGGIPFAAGLGLFFLGRGLLRSQKRAGSTTEEIERKDHE